MPIAAQLYAINIVPRLYSVTCVSFLASPVWLPADHMLPMPQGRPLTSRKAHLVLAQAGDRVRPLGENHWDSDPLPRAGHVSVHSPHWLFLFTLPAPLAPRPWWWAALLQLQTYNMNSWGAAQLNLALVALARSTYPQTSLRKDLLRRDSWRGGSPHTEQARTAGLSLQRCSVWRFMWKGLPSTRW